MKLELETERLLLRPLRESDLDLAFAILMDPEVMRFIAKAYTREQVLAELPHAVRRGGGGCIGIWCVVDRATSEKLGTVLLLPLPIETTNTDWDLVGGDELPDCDIELGYILRPMAWGRGVATEAATRLLEFAFEESPLREVVAVTHPENAASQRVLRKCGLTYEGIRRAYASDCHWFRITRDEGRQQQGS